MGFGVAGWSAADAEDVSVAKSWFYSVECGVDVSVDFRDGDVVVRSAEASEGESCSVGGVEYVVAPSQVVDRYLAKAVCGCGCDTGREAGCAGAGLFDDVKAEFGESSGDGGVGEEGFLGECGESGGEEGVGGESGEEFGAEGEFAPTACLSTGHRVRERTKSKAPSATNGSNSAGKPSSATRPPTKPAPPTVSVATTTSPTPPFTTPPPPTPTK